MNIYFYAAQKEKQDLLDKKMKENALFCISLGVLFFFQIIRMRSIFLGIISTSNLVFSIAFTLFICVKFIFEDKINYHIFGQIKGHIFLPYLYIVIF